MSVQTNNTGLITKARLANKCKRLKRIHPRLSNVGEDAVNHAYKHAVLEGMTGVLDNGDNIRPMF